jgi:hypothetical protein
VKRASTDDARVTSEVRQCPYRVRGGQAGPRAPHDLHRKLDAEPSRT